MPALYTYSLIAVLAVSLLLFSTAALQARASERLPTFGLTLYCASIAVWSGSLFLTTLPGYAGLAERLAASGAFVVASFMHVAYDYSKQSKYGLVWLGYSAATLITVVGLVNTGLLYSPGSYLAGPLFWPSMALATCASALPVWRLAQAYQRADVLGRRQLVLLGVSGIVGFSGALWNAVALTRDDASPIPMLMVLASLLILAGLLRQSQRAAGRRLLERSLIFAALTALLSTAFLVAVLTWLRREAAPLLEHGLGLLFVLFMAALAFEPLRQRVQQALAGRLLTAHASSAELASELARQEERAAQAQRLAELGQFTSAVAHEVRNPLGVISAHARLLEEDAANVEACEAIREQVQRASHFVDDLLRYGRPRPLELEMLDISAILALARSTAVSARRESDESALQVQWQMPNRSLIVEADSAQLLQVFVVLFSNSLEAMQSSPKKRCRVTAEKRGDRALICIEDSGAGLPEEIAERVFEPFVTGRKREGAGGGTGLGLAIGRAIVQRHQGEIVAGASDLGGAQFSIDLPTVQRILDKD